MKVFQMQKKKDISLDLNQLKYSQLSSKLTEIHEKYFTKIIRLRHLYHEKFGP